LAKTLRALCLGVALVALMVVCAGSIFLSAVRQPASTSDTPIAFEVKQGDSTSTIATNLRSAGLIRVPQLFTLLVRLQGMDGNLRTGSYQLRPNMTMSQIIAALQTGIKIEEVELTTIEGWRLEEIAEAVGVLGLPNVTAESFLAAARNGAAFKKDYFKLNSLPDDASLEGYLFPDTYRIASTATVTEVLDTMLANFDQKYSSFETAVQVSASVHQIVTMASIVQREATQKDEMPKIAAVFWNRLKPENAGQFGGGQLGSDPTVQYILGQPGNWWPKLDTLSADEIRAAGQGSPRQAYNTRAQGGLPPGPISNPGLDALRAAAQPDSSAPYQYFVVSCESPGTHKFATTYEEFLQYQQDYLSCPKP
jgi:UPF0755 protein